MSEKIIDIVVKPGGEVSVETSGFVGTECTDHTNLIKQILAGNVVSESFKPEYYMENEENINRVA